MRRSAADNPDQRHYLHSMVRCMAGWRSDAMHPKRCTGAVPTHFVVAARSSVGGGCGCRSNLHPMVRCARPCRAHRLRELFIKRLSLCRVTRDRTSGSTILLPAINAVAFMFVASGPFAHSGKFRRRPLAVQIERSRCAAPSLFFQVRHHNHCSELLLNARRPGGSMRTNGA